MAQTKEITVIEMVVEYLKANGYDGLAGKDCGCEIDYLIPCGCFDTDCVAGHKVTKKEDCELHDTCELRYCDDAESVCIIPGKRGENQ